MEIIVQLMTGHMKDLHAQSAGAAINTIHEVRAFKVHVLFRGRCSSCIHWANVNVQ